MTDLKGFTSLETEDGSTTLFSHRYNEACHSTSGAKAETIFHYINGCQIQEKARKLASESSSKKELVILEVGFGTGLGLELTYKALESISDLHVNFISLELSAELINYFLLQNKIANYSFKNSVHSFYLSDRFKVFILEGDARETLTWIKSKFKIHAIYQDAFSPKKNPELWTLEWFKELKELARSSCVLSTYCSSLSVRKTMIEAGWTLREGGSFGKKRSSTRASLSGNSKTNILDQVSSPKIAILTDQKLKLS